MHSHTYDFETRDLLWIIGPSLIPVVLFAALMHSGARLNILPKPRPTLDVDRTILVNKIDASRTQNDAEVLLIGDSSCLMDIDARQLGAEIGRPVWNLGTLSYLGLDSQAALLRQFGNANPHQAKAIVLLMHPEALRLASPGGYHTRFVARQMQGQDFFLPGRPRDYVLEYLGFEIFRGRIVARMLPAPLGGAYGRRYGFSFDLENYLRDHRGSAVDPDIQRLAGSAEYRLAAQFEATSRVFREAVPSGVRLLVGITPVPSRFAGRDSQITLDAILRTWQSWLRPDAVLSDLPLTLPDHLFVRTTHLSEEGARLYTSTLARSIR